MAIILVTGASRGIGLATVLALARAGHTVHAAVRDPERVPELVHAVASEGLPIHVTAMDVDFDLAVAEACCAMERTSGPIEVLVNNAGIERMGSVEELPMGDFRAIMETNYFGALRCIKALLPGMRTRRRGCIVNVSSVSGRVAAAPMAAYAASKFALEALSEALAQEATANGIRVAIVEPGIIDTDMARNIATPEGGLLYPQRRRIAGLFSATLAVPTPPAVVADKIREIIESETTQLRHPAGPTAEPFLQWRASMSDDRWVELGAADDDTWYARVERDFGVKARL